ncbi:MAG TPA: response regulator [Nitrososphaeraceae archaeon]|nr:response regulator [Nitrososphaeraceae archaeon]
MKNFKIMIVEDEEDILILYRDFLSGKGHEVTTTYLDADVRIEDIVNAGCEIYLIDYRLPGNKNGIDVASQILDKFPKAPILFISAFENLNKEISKNPIFHGKNVEVLLKPVKLDKIESTLISLLDR